MDHELYLSGFEEFTKNKKYVNIFKNSRTKSTNHQKITEEKQNFDSELEVKGQTSLFESLASIDKTRALRSLLDKANLSQLSAEITKVTEFVNSHNEKGAIDSKRDSSMIFLVSLDYLVKGLLTHWQITLKDKEQGDTISPAIKEKLKKRSPMLNYGVQYNILLGDQFHAKAYYMTSRLGSNDLCKILSTIEENFAKIIFRQNYDSNNTKNLKKLYKDFYNYLPTFFGHGFKGLAIIHEMGTSDIESSFKLGIEYGF